MRIALVARRQPTIAVGDHSHYPTLPVKPPVIGFGLGNVDPDACLCHNPSRQTVRDQLQPFLDESDPTYNHTVYVLECKPRHPDNATSIALTALDVQRVPDWTPAAMAHDRLFYVGLSKRAAERLSRHAIGSGVHFTTVFPPVRLVDVDWYTTLARSYREELQKTDGYRRDYPDAYVSQPG